MARRTSRRPRKVHQNTLKVGSFFSGINAVWVALLGLAHYNLCHCFMVEHDEALGAFTSKTRGLNPDKNYGDVTTIAMKQLERVHVFQWSPPCFPFHTWAQMLAVSTLTAIYGQVGSDTSKSTSLYVGSMRWSKPSPMSSTEQII